MQYFRVRIPLLLCLVVLAPWTVTAEVLHQDSTYQDFAAGEVGTSVANLYVSRAGRVQMINRWDLNQDGYLDIIFNNSHSTTHSLDALVFSGRRQDFSPTPDLGLPTLGGSYAAISDLNNDGHNDVVIANGFDGASRQTGLYIYYGSAQGLNPRRRCLLPGRDLVGLAIGDVDGDGLADIIFASRYQGGSLQVFWGTSLGFTQEQCSKTQLPGLVKCAAGNFWGDSRVEVITAAGDDHSVQLWQATNNDRSLTKRQDLGAPGTRRLLTAQVTGGPRPELVCIRTEQPRLLIYEATDTKFAAQPVMELALPAASGCALADLNEDGFTDLVASRLDGSTCGIYWGDESGFSPERVQKLPGINGADACTGDFNGDGSLDIGIANEHEGNERATFSYVYWGQDGRFSPDNRTELPTDGAKQMLAGDVTGDKLTDLVVLSPIGGQIRARMPCRIYWGQSGGQFSAEYYTELEARAPYESTMADFNDDGFTDIFISNSWEGESDSDRGSNVFWGGPTGFSTRHRTVLATKGAMGSSAADFNKDGYLDLAITSRYGHDVLFWGGEDGFSDDRRISLADPQGRVASGGHSICADLNKDGWVDVINPHIYQPYAAIHWGGPDDFVDHNLTLLPTSYASAIEVADLNSDGWLELLISGFWNSEEPDSRWRVPTLIYWGGPDGFSEKRVQDLPSIACHDISVADLNNDGVLDIVMSSYRDQTWRSVPSYIYWGEPGGVYRWDNCSQLYNHSAAGNLIADFNQDGWLDLVFTNHTKRGNHNTLSRVWWNSPDGFNERDITFLPTFGAHQMASTDIGNAYDRRLEETYISQPIEIAAGTVAGRLTWQAHTPFGTHIKFQIRQARRLVGLKQAQWGGPGGTGTYYGQPGELRPCISGPRWIQYRAILCTPDGGNSPILEQVTLETSQ